MIQFGTSISETARSSLKPSKTIMLSRYRWRAIAESLFGALECDRREVDVEGKVYRVVGVMEKAPGGLFGGDPVEIESSWFPSRPSSGDHPEIDDITVTSRLSPIIRQTCDENHRG